MREGLRPMAGRGGGGLRGLCTPYLFLGTWVCWAYLPKVHTNTYKRLLSRGHASFRGPINFSNNYEAIVYLEMSGKSRLRSLNSVTTEVIASKGQPSAICQRANPRIRKAQPFFRTFPLSARRLEGPTQSPLSSPDFLLITTKNVTLPAWPLTGGKPFFPSKTSFQLH